MRSCSLICWLSLADYTLLSMTVMVNPCLWYVVGMKMVCPMSKFPQAPFARAPFGECQVFLDSLQTFKKSIHDPILDSVCRKGRGGLGGEGHVQGRSCTHWKPRDPRDDSFEPASLTKNTANSRILRKSRELLIEPRPFFL